MRSRRLVRLVTFFSLLALVFCRPSGADTHLAVPESHPRVIVNSSDLNRIKGAIRTYSKTDFDEVLKYVRWRMQETSPAEIATQNDHPNVILPIALSASLSEDASIVEYGIECGIELSNLNANSGEDTERRYRLLNLAIIYDFLAEKMSPSKRKKIAKSIVTHITSLKYFLETPSYTGGHSRFGNAALLAGVLAVFREYDQFDDSKTLEALIDRWKNGYNPFQSFVAQDGGYHMGWQYGLGYTTLWPYLMWRSIGASEMVPPFLKNLPFWYIYGLRGDGTLPRSGDCNDPRVGQDLCPLMAFCSYQYGDGYAEGFYRTYLENMWGPYRVWRVMFKNPDMTPLFPSEAGLERFRHFRNSGFVIGRDGWDEKSTLMVFKSTPFFTVNHQHNDQNHFTVSYKGSLLIDSGVYDSYGSRHWKNYYRRTIAHNTMVVFDPNEAFLLNGERLSNDGGQSFPSITSAPVGMEPTSLEDVFADKYRLEGVIGFGRADDGCWTRGDATRAYSGNKVTSYVRDVVMISKLPERHHPVIIVWDKIELRKSLRPKILFHFDREPAMLSGNYFKVANEKGGCLHLEVLFPQNVRIDVVGGAGREWLVNGVNYPPVDSWDPTLIEAGAWRAEVGGDSNTDKAEYVSVLSVDDMASPQGKPDCKLLKGNGYAGAVFDSSFVLIVDANVISGEVRFSGSEFDAIETIYVAGLGGEGEWVLRLNDRRLNIKGGNPFRKIMLKGLGAPQGFLVR